MSSVGSTVGNIRIEYPLGSGGMGEVYLGFDPRLERRVALKTIRPEQRLSAEVKARFLREARLLSKLGHPGICQVYDLIETPEADFLVLEYIEGQTLRQLAAGEELPLDQKLRLAVRIAEILAVAHREQVVHRDLKAENVMVTPGGEVKVLDFGVARSLSAAGGPVLDPLGPASAAGPAPPGLDDEALDATWTPPFVERPALPPRSPRDAAEELTEELTRFGSVVGTIRSMSPEQAAGRPVTTASDLYSFGILLQELLTGMPAYVGRGRGELWGQVVRAETVPLAGTDPEVAALVSDLLNLDPRRRPTAEQAVERLRWILDRPQRLRRRRLRLMAVAGGFAVLSVLLAVVTWLAVEAERSRREADLRRRQAEDLIGFMLGDLRPKLEEVGRLELLDAVGDRALAYFEAVPRERWSDEELAQRAEAILQIGEVRYLRGGLPEALATFRSAGLLAAELARRSPDHAKLEGLRFSTHTWAGQVYFDQGRTDEALAEWRQAVDLARERLRREPESSEAKDVLASAHHNLGSLLAVRGDRAGALSSYRESLALKRRVAAASPGNLRLQTELGGTLAFVSDSLERSGDLAGALAERGAYLALQERLAAREPRNSRFREDLTRALGFHGGLVAALGDPRGAEALYRRGLAASEALVAQDRENTYFRRSLGAFRSALGRVRLEQGDPAGALAELRQARPVFAALVEQDPTNTDWRLQLGLCRGRAAAALARLDPAGAREEAEGALSLLEPLTAEDPDETIRGAAAEAALALARAEEARGAAATARAARERALALLAPCRRPLLHWKQLDPWVQAQFGLGRRAEALPELRRLLAMGYRGADIVALARREGVLGS